MDAARIQLIERYCDGSLSEAEARELLALLRGDPSFKEAFAEALAMRGMIDSALDEDAECERLAAVVGSAIGESKRPGEFESRLMRKVGARGKVLRTPSRSYAVPIGIAAMVAVAVILFVVFARRKPEQPIAGVLHAPSGNVSVLRDGKTLRPEPKLGLYPKDQITVAPGATAGVFLLDMSHLELGGDTVLTVEDARGTKMRIEKGTVSVDAYPQKPGERLVFSTPHATTEVVGTRFKLMVFPTVTRLSVSEGTVNFTPVESGKMAAINADQTASAGPGVPRVPAAVVPAAPPKREVAWPTDTTWIRHLVRGEIAESDAAKNRVVLRSLPAAPDQRTDTFKPEAVVLVLTPNPSDVLFKMPQNAVIHLRVKSERAGTIGLAISPTNPRFENEHNYKQEIPVGPEWRTAVIPVSELVPLAEARPLAGQDVQSFGIWGFGTGMFQVDFQTFIKGNESEAKQ